MGQRKRAVYLCLRYFCCISVPPHPPAARADPDV